MYAAAWVMARGRKFSFSRRSIDAASSHSLFFGNLFRRSCFASVTLNGTTATVFSRFTNLSPNRLSLVVTSIELLELRGIYLTNAADSSRLLCRDGAWILVPKRTSLSSALSNTISQGPLSSSLSHSVTTSRVSTSGPSSPGNFSFLAISL